MDFGKILIGVGVVLAVLGTVSALQGVGLIGGSSLMDGNSTFIYVGSLITVGGLVMIAFGLRPATPKPKKNEPKPNEGLPVVQWLGRFYGEIRLGKLGSQFP
jgi:hypothetical protein